MAGERRVEVERTDGGTQTLTASRAVVVATGGRANMPPIDGLGTTRVWTNEEVTQASQVPERFIVLGGGPVGCEMAQA